MNTQSRTRYQEILDDLRGRIVSGELAGGDRLPTFSELRAQVGASQATVARVYSLLEQEGLISRERGKGIFVADQSRRELTGLIGYIGGHFSQRQVLRFSAELVEGIEEVLHREQLRVLLLSEESSVGWDKVDGMLIAGSSKNIMLDMLPPRVPVVWLLQTVGGHTSVVQDDFGGAKAGIEYLIELGHRKIALLIQQTDGSLRLRVAGYEEALAGAGLTVDPAWIRDPRIAMPKSGYREWGFVSMKKWLAGGFERLGVTALFVQNDLAAAGVLDALHEHEVSVPQQLSVMSFDGTDVCDFTKPKLTSVYVPLREIGATATEVLIEEIRTPGSRPRSIVLPTSIRQGESTDSPRENQQK